MIPLPEALPSNLPNMLVQAAHLRPERGVVLYDKRGKTFERRNYPEFLKCVQLQAARLSAAGVKPGERVIIAAPTSWTWLENWFGAVWLGAWPVAIAPGAGFGPSEAQMLKIEAAAEMLGASRVIGETSLKEELIKYGAKHASKITSTSEELARLSVSSSMAANDADPNATAFLQLTSGSTGRQRAVMISHLAAMHNPMAMDQAAGAPFGSPGRNWATRVVCWLPLYHDMGLIGCTVYSMVNGLDIWLLRPETFLARPRVWLELLGQPGAALTPAPNFAYQACSERVKSEDLEGVDLSNWRAAMTGAEMVRPGTCASFARAFESRGFSAKTFRPCYGLAEATLAVAIDRKGAGIRTLPVPGKKEIEETVSLGHAVLDTEIRILPHTAPIGPGLLEGQIGEVLVRGPGVFQGYYRDPEATAECLLENWLRTGDLGFLKEGELYLTGRVKEILILNGHNVMPHELETIADTVTGGGGTERSGAFAVSGQGSEQAVLVAEWAGDDASTLPNLAYEIRSRIGHALTLPLADVMFVRRGQIPKTTSGKVQRGELRKRYLEGKLERIQNS